MRVPSLRAPYPISPIERRNALILCRVGRFRYGLMVSVACTISSPIMSTTTCRWICVKGWVLSASASRNRSWNRLISSRRSTVITQ